MRLPGISIELGNGQALSDLSWKEDSIADVDCNTDEGQLLEIQATAEAHTFQGETMDTLLNSADSGINELIKIQREALREV